MNLSHATPKTCPIDCRPAPEHEVGSYCIHAEHKSYHDTEYGVPYSCHCKCHSPEPDMLATHKAWLKEQGLE